ncbi:MAG TPA: CoA transferase [Acidimicrobiales bacterium]|jgi:crotonobetainyl-CoA:carnitine CoA-transferase CaiB-like acyl-CoA transferase|nr:CoA transferase [Acidimicrobiales bacterium]
MSSLSDASATGPLAGVKVVELGVWVAGPAAGGILADWGADVIKIEPPTGDPARTFRRMLGGDLPSNPVFELDNRSKRSISLDLSMPEGRSVAHQLVAGADVFLTNIRPSALERAGLDPEAARAGNDRLVYAIITGYGLAGPDADRPAYDIAAYWARSGLASALTPPDGSLPFQRGGMGDHTAGMSTAGMISAALYAREKTGKGDLVSTSLLRQGAYTLGFDVNISLMWGLPVRVGTRTTMGNPCINNYSAGDGKRFWIVGLEGSRHWPPLARVVGHPEWIDDERYATGLARAMNAVALIAELDAIFATRPLAEWAELFAAEPDFFWSPVQSIEDLIADPQFAAGGGLVDVPDESGTMTMVASPADFADRPAKPRYRAPRLGEHTAGVLGEMGWSTSDIEGLVNRGVAFDEATSRGPD